MLASPDSPLGAALLGRAIDDEVEYQAPAGALVVKIVSVRPYDG
jgi:transcription elongation GreA/GreB family factor